MIQAPVFAERRAFTDQRINRFAETCSSLLGSVEPRVVGDHACVYAAGSAGRGELTPHSDLDVFLVDTGFEDVDTRVQQREVHRLNGIVLQSAVIRTMETLKLDPPSNGGEF